MNNPAFNSSEIKFNNNIISINSDYFQNLIVNNKSNNKIIEYCLYHMNECDKKKNIYISELFLKKNSDNSLFQEALDEYQNNFEKVIDIIDELFKNLLDNLFLLPYSIKCICKIIFILVKKNIKDLILFNNMLLYLNFFLKNYLIQFFKIPV
jgi:hypothetical protein